MTNRAGRIVSRRPHADECDDHDCRRWIALVPGDCAIDALGNQNHWLCELASSLSTDQIDRSHPPHRWTVRQVIEHCADAERVFGYRMLRIAAGDETELPSWDQDAYAESRFGLGNFGHLVAELGALRRANVLLLKRLVPKAWDRIGTAGAKRMSVRALAWVTAGHLHHHLSIIEQRCGIEVDRVPPQ
jgi:hypothetical protein